MVALRPREGVRVEAVLLHPDGEVPNNPRLPLLLYPGVLGTPRTPDPDALARTFEALFDAHGWPGPWRNGLFSFDHYHSNAHEVLGIYEGEADVLFGGPNGELVRVAAGDMVVVPAGVGHKKVRTRGRLGVVGSYPAGQNPDLCRPGEPGASPVRVRVPCTDPAYGRAGPLLQYWT